MMKVLLLADGSSIHAARYKDELRGQGIEVILASLEKGDPVDIELTRKTGMKVIDYSLAGRTIINIAKEISPDIINPHFASGYGYMTAVSGLWKNYPVLLHCLGSDILISPQKSWLHKKKVLYALSKASYILADSEYLVSEAKEIYPGDNYRIIAWGADNSAFDNFESKKSSNFKWHQPVRIIVPRPHNKIYNNRFIIGALREPIAGRQITIAFPNWGDGLVEFKNLLNEEQITDGVELYNLKSRKEFNEYLSEFDIYLSASTSDSSPASLIEAMASGLYPIVADIPGVREWLTTDNGSLFESNNVDSLRQAVIYILESRDNLEKVLIGNYEKANTDGRFADNIAETIKIMERLIDDTKQQ